MPTKASQTPSSASDKRTAAFLGRHLDVVVPPNAAAVLAGFNPDISFLQAFFPPDLSLVDFHERYHGKKCLAYKASQVKSGLQRMEALIDEHLCGGDLKELLERTPSESISCWVRNSTTGAIDTVRVGDAKTALKHHKAGASLYFRAPKDEFESEFVPAVSDGLGFGRLAYFDPAQAEPQGEVETFLSKKGHLTSWHVDFQTNFTLQLTGKKRWTVKSGSGTPASAARAVTPHYKTAPDVAEQQIKTHLPASSSFDFKPADLEEGCESVVLEAGDCFYFPPGMWHKVECLEDSWSVNISIVALTWGDVMASATKALMRRACVGRSFAGLHQYHPLTGPMVSSALISSTAASMGAAGAALALCQTMMASLKPGHLLPPIAMLSHRFSGIPQLGDTDDDDDDDGDNDEPWSPSRQEALAAWPGSRVFGPSSAFDTVGSFLGQQLRLWLHADGTPVVTVFPTSAPSSAPAKAGKGKPSKTNTHSGSASAVEQSFSVNPLAVVFRAQLVDAAASGSGRAAAAMASVPVPAANGTKAKRSGSKPEKEVEASAAQKGPAGKRRRLEPESKEDVEEDDDTDEEDEEASPFPPAPSDDFVTYLITVNNGEGEDGFTPVARAFLQVPSSLAPAVDHVAALTAGYEDRKEEVAAMTTAQLTALLGRGAVAGAGGDDPDVTALTRGLMLLGVAC